MGKTANEIARLGEGRDWPPQTLCRDWRAFFGAESTKAAADFVNVRSWRKAVMLNCRFA